MKRIILVLMIFCLISPSSLHAETASTKMKIVFSRDGYLWIKEGENERRITENRALYNYPPQWSFDGRMILYQKEVTGSVVGNKKTSNELWVYDTNTKKHQKIFYDGYNPKWSPTENIIAFSDGGVLNISDLKTFYNIALGVNEYQWQPDGKGFIASSSASIRPDGWTHPILYMISIADGYRNIQDLTKNTKKFFVVPKELVKGDVKIQSINAESLTYSPNTQWISFIVSAFPSWSMDSNMICILSADGKQFEVIDETINMFTPKWAFNKNTLGYIAGGGRIVFGFKNKDLKVTEPTTGQTETLTPKNYAELGFSWVNDNSLIVSRVPESEWSNDPDKRPKPALYFVTFDNEKQTKITTPSSNKGDYDPIFLPSIQKITWLRKKDISLKGDLWIADPTGQNAEVWVQNIGLYDFYPAS